MLCFFLLLQFSNYSILEIEKYYQNSYNFTNDSLKNYEHIENFLDLKQVFLRETPYQFKKNSFKQWHALRTRAINGKLINQSITDIILRDYAHEDIKNVVDFYRLLSDLYRRKVKYSELKEKISKTNLENEPQLIRFLHYSNLYQLENHGEHGSGYFKTLIECYKYDLKTNNQYNLMCNDFMLYYGMRYNYFYDYIIPFLSSILKKDLSKIEKNYKYYRTKYLLFMIEAYVKLNNLKNAKDVYNNLPPDISNYDKVMSKLIFSDKPIEEKQFNGIEQSEYKLNAIRKNELLALKFYFTKKDTTNIRIIYKKILANSANKKYLAFYTLAYRYFFDDEVDIKFLNLVKGKFKKDINNYLSSNKINSSIPMEDYIEFFLIKLAFKKPINMVDDYLFFNSHKKYLKNIKRKIRNKRTFELLLEKKQSYLRSIDNINRLDTYANLVKADLEEGLLIDSVRLDSPFSKVLTYDILREKIEQDQVILFYLEAFGDKVNIQISQDTVKVFNVDSTHNYLSEVKNKHIVVLSNSHVPEGGLDSIFIANHQVIPRISYVLDIHDFEKKSSVELNSASFWGTGKPFMLKKRNYPELSFIQDEKTLLKELPLDFHINNLNTDILHFSSHYIESEHHTLFSKIAYEENDSVKLFSGYDLIGKNLLNQITVLNSCRSNQHIRYDNFSGEKSFVSFFLNAGSKSVLATNTDIDDFTSVVLIEKFYEYLMDGIDAVTSLQQAKQYIYNNISTDPKYWATTQFYGQNFVVISSSFSRYFWLIGFLIFTLIVFILKKIK